MSEFISNTYRAIDIIDGTDVQDSNLYNWLTENATQYNPASYCLINTNKYIARAHWGTSNISKMYLGAYNIFKSLPLLYTPTISLSGTNLTISTTDDNTYYFDIYANGTRVESIETPDGFEVTINFTNGYDTSYWQYTKIYNAYNIQYPNLYVNSSDKIGEINSANGSTTVLTTTGTIIILGAGNHTEHYGTITPSTGITLTGSWAWVSGGSGTALSGWTDSGSTYEDNVALAYGGANIMWVFSVEASGTITINNADWHD